MSRAIALSVALCCGLGCALVRQAEQGVTGIFRGREQVTESDLREQLFDFRSAFVVMIGEAADRISNETADTQVRRRSLLWKIRMPDAATIVVANPNPREAYVEALTLAIAQRQFLADGGGASLFGPQQPIAAEAARAIEERAIAIGRSFLNDEQLGELRLGLEKIASENPIRGEFLREGVAAGIEKAESRGAFDEILALPMAPFRALEGMDTGAQAIREFNVTAQQATDVVADLPQRVRWQLELLTYDLQAQGGALQQALASFDTLAQSSDRLSLAAENLPEDTRATLEAAGTELERLQKLLAEYRAAVAETNGALTTSQPLADALARTAEQVNQAGVAWNSIVTQLETPNEPPPPGAAPGRPFDIREYEQTAQSITRTAEELRLLLGDMKAAEAGLVTAIARRVVIGASILIAVFFGFLLLYRVLAARLARARE